MAELINDYRPSALDEVWGHAEQCAALERIIEADDAHALLFVGPSGVGKTTLARIFAARKGCLPQNVHEMDAASYSGVDDVRAITSRMAYKGMGGSPVRVCIIDECHSLSKNAWQALLKSIEEPPSHLYWCLCTTEEGKVPSTIVTRCSVIRLGLVDEDEIFSLIESIRDSEQFACDDEVLSLVARKAEGSPRAALSMLSVVATAEDRRSAAALLRTYDEGDDHVREFCRALLAGRDLTAWSQVQPLLESFMGKGAESIRIQVCAYVRKAILGAKSGKQIARPAEVLDAFGTPFPSQGQDDQLVLATLRACFGGN